MPSTNLIDKSYFWGPLNVVNTQKSEVEELLDGYITKYQKEFLNDILGVDLATTFIAVVDKTVAPWKGLNDLLVDGTAKTSPIANLAYYWLTRDAQTQTVRMGQVKAKAENAAVADSSIKLVRAYNEMSEQILPIYKYCRANFDAAFPKWSCIWEKYSPINWTSI